jgi:hypothetical protein
MKTYMQFWAYLKRDMPDVYKNEIFSKKIVQEKKHFMFITYKNHQHSLQFSRQVNNTELKC